MAEGPDNSGADPPLVLPASRYARGDIVRLTRAQGEHPGEVKIDTAVQTEGEAGMVHKVGDDIRAANARHQPRIRHPDQGVTKRSYPSGAPNELRAEQYLAGADIGVFGSDIYCGSTHLHRKIAKQDSKVAPGIEAAIDVQSVIVLIRGLEDCGLRPEIYVGIRETG